MFDNQNNLPAGSVPNNLPMGEPEDMFSGSESEQALPQPEPLDLPPTALDAGVLRPKNESSSVPMVEPEMPSLAEPMPATQPITPMVAPRREVAPMPMPMPMPMNANSDGVLAAPLGGHKALITIIILLSLIIIGGGSAWAYFTYINPPETQILPNNTAVLSTTTNNNVPAPEPLVPTTTPELSSDATSTDNRILFGEPVLDTDSDGLDDSVEKEMGTNMLTWDSDGDTLSDGDEVLTWKTDPLKSDTDNDGYDDAAEIKNGYNPRGEGRLFAVTSTVSNTSVTTSTAETKL